MFYMNNPISVIKYLMPKERNEQSHFQSYKTLLLIPLLYILKYCCKSIISKFYIKGNQIQMEACEHSTKVILFFPRKRSILHVISITVIINNITINVRLLVHHTYIVTCNI